MSITSATDRTIGEHEASYVLTHAGTPLRPGTPEAAIAVGDTWKRQGVGWALLRHAADLAAARGVRRLRCIESRANHEAIEVERALGFRARGTTAEPGLIVMEADIG